MPAIAASSCSAVPVDDLMVCDRCGAEWPAGGVRPACDPITFSVLQAHLMAEMNSVEAWLSVLTTEKAVGKPVDPGKQRRRVALTAALLRLVEKLMSDPSLMARLTAKKT